MTRMLYFAAGLAIGTGLAGAEIPYITGAAAHRAAKAAERVAPHEKPRQYFLEQRCAPGFRHSTPDKSGRYTCNREAVTRCPNGSTAVNVRLWRSGNAAGDSRLLYECRAGEPVRPHCGRGFVPANLRLYRAGTARAEARLLYDCVRYRPGNK